MKTKLLSLAVALLLGQSVTAQDYHWPLKANLDDVIGGKNGTNHGVTFVNDEVRGPVAYFNGDSYANLPSFINGQSQITISIWFRMDEKRVWSRIYNFGKGDQSEPKDVLMVIPASGAVEQGTDPEHNMYRFTLSNPGGPWYDIDFFKEEIDVQLGTWYMSTVVLTPGRITIYHNDQKKFDEEGFDRDIATLEDIENALGKSFWPDAMWKGALSDLRVWKKGLTAEEVKAVFEIPVDPGNNSIAITSESSPIKSIYSQNGRIHVTMRNEAQKAQVSVYNVLGSLITKASIDRIQDVSFRSGIYIVKVTSSDGAVFSRKVSVR